MDGPVANKASGIEAGGLFAGLQGLVGIKSGQLCHPRQGAAEIISLRLKQVPGFQWLGIRAHA